MAALPTSNLSVDLILSTLGVTTAKDIFYLSGSLRSISNFGTIVNKNGLDPAYCSGATADDRLQNLLTYRNLSRFKGYNPVTPYVYFYNRGVALGVWGDYYLYSNGLVTITREATYLKIVKATTAWSRAVFRTSELIQTIVNNYIRDNGLKLNIIMSIISGSGSLNYFRGTTSDADGTVFSTTGNTNLPLTFTAGGEIKYTGAAVSSSLAEYSAITLLDLLETATFEIHIHEIFYE